MILTMELIPENCKIILFIQMVLVQNVAVVIVPSILFFQFIIKSQQLKQYLSLHRIDFSHSANLLFVICFVNCAMCLF